MSANLSKFSYRCEPINSAQKRTRRTTDPLKVAIIYPSLNFSWPLQAHWKLKYAASCCVQSRSLKGGGRKRREPGPETHCFSFFLPFLKNLFFCYALIGEYAVSNAIKQDCKCVRAIVVGKVRCKIIFPNRMGSLLPSPHSITPACERIQANENILLLLIPRKPLTRRKKPQTCTFLSWGVIDQRGARRHLYT